MGPWGYGKVNFLLFFDFLDPEPVWGVLDIELLIPEVWDFYLFSGATFFFGHKPSKNQLNIVQKSSKSHLKIGQRSAKNHPKPPQSPTCDPL